MAAVVKRNGSRFWYVVWHQDGHQVWRSTKTEDRDLAEQVKREVVAAREGRQREDQIRGILETASRTTLAPAAVPVAAAWEIYLKQPQPRRTREKTLRDKKAAVERFLTWLHDRHPEIRHLQQVTEQHAGAYFAALAAEGLRGQTRNNRLSALHSVWSLLRIPARLDRNPWTAVPRVEAGSQRHEAMTLDQVRALLAAAVGKEDSQAPGFWPAAIALGYHTGLRFGDVCTLTWDEVDADRRQIRLVPRKGWKAAREVTVPVPDEALAMLPPAPAPRTGNVWPAAANGYLTAARWPFEELRALFRTAKIQTERDGRKVIGFHSLRHTYVTLLENAGVDRATIQTLVGHGSPAMTQHYSHSQAAAKKAKGKMPSLQEKTARRAD